MTELLSEQLNFLSVEAYIIDPWNKSIFGRMVSLPLIAKKSELYE